MIHAGVPSFFVLGSEDGHIPTVWLLLYQTMAHTSNTTQTRKKKVRVKIRGPQFEPTAEDINPASSYIYIYAYTMLQESSTHAFYE